MNFISILKIKIYLIEREKKKMNRIERINEKEFRIILNINEENEMIFDKNNIDYDIWYEKKINDFHLRLSDKIFEICGRKYFRISKFNNSDFIEFENKEERRVLENWKDKMNDDEKEEYERLEKRMNEIKDICMKRKSEKIEKNSLEWYEREIEKMMKKREKLLNK